MKRDALIAAGSAGFVALLLIAFFIGHAVGYRAAEERVFNVLLRDLQPEKDELLKRYAPSYQQMIDEFSKPMPEN